MLLSRGSEQGRIFEQPTRNSPKITHDPSDNVRDGLRANIETYRTKDWVN